MMIDRVTGEQINKHGYAYIRKPMDTSIKVTSDPVGESKTHQSFREETDINVIMDRFQRTGQLPPSRQREPQYMDVSELNKPLSDVINQTAETLEKSRNFFNEKEKTAKDAAKKAAREAADAASKQTKGAASETGAPQAKAPGGASTNTA